MAVCRSLWLCNFAGVLLRRPGTRYRNAVVLQAARRRYIQTINLHNSTSLCAKLLRSCGYPARRLLQEAVKCIVGRPQGASLLIITIKMRGKTRASTTKT